MDRESVYEIAEDRGDRFASLMSQSGFILSDDFRDALVEEFANCAEDDYEDQDDFASIQFLMALRLASVDMRL